ncbi:MAG: nucleoside monophosphate kinase [Pirellulaceae bacterium]
MRLVLLGPPGVGKGTQAELLNQRFGACHLSTGELFRAARCAADHSPAMREALAAMQRGELVADELVVRMVRERSQCLRCCGGFLLDGVPRTVAQVEALDELFEELGVSLDAVLSYELDLEAIVRRLSGRRTCSDCSAVFHLASRPPRDESVCDHCGGRLLQRDDDHPDAVRVRMGAYRQATQPLQDFYRRRNLLISISAQGRPDEIAQRTFRSLENRLGVLTD